jgi:AraC-like DNA-binding protein
VARRYGSFPEWQLARFHGHNQPLPEFPALSHVHEGVALAGHDLPPHAHPHFEICYIHAGKGLWFAEGQQYKLKAGDIYITKPGEIHGGKTDPRDPYHIFALCLDLSALPQAPFGAGSSHKKLTAKSAGTAAQRDVASAVCETQAFHEGFAALDRRVIPGGAGLETCFRRLLQELDAPAQAGQKSRAWKVLVVQALLVELLVFVARRCAAHTERRKPEGPLPLPGRPKFQELLAWLGERVADPPTLSEMAEFCDLSPAHFAVAFKRETGATPLEAVTRLRIEAAAVRLAAPGRASVTDVALDLGFSSAQYFSLVFRKVKGCAPTEWRRKGPR